jgi:hypothetical protein
MRALLVLVCVSACATGQLTTSAVQQAATVFGGGDGQAGTCSNEGACTHTGGGTGDLLLPIAAIGAVVLVVAGVTYVNSIVQTPARIPRTARTP